MPARSPMRTSTSGQEKRASCTEEWAFTRVGVLGGQTCALTFAPARSSARTRVTSPVAATIISAVPPAALVACTSAPFSSTASAA
eukprot:1823627-Pyramimonas_sp.AAC.2